VTYLAAPVLGRPDAAASGKLWISLGLKYIRLVLQMADSSGTPMPLASLAHDHFLAALATVAVDHPQEANTFKFYQLEVVLEPA
jgi:3-hydroxyisobutyrate dehydrogenase-like beta-hydroxyacid dehydrogenase